MRRATFARLVRRYGDLVLAVVLATGCTLELVGYAPADHPLAMPLGTIAGLVQAVRRRSPLVVFVVVLGCTAGLEVLADDFPGHSVFIVAIFMLTLYSVGAYATGVEAWLGGAAMLVAVVGLVVVDTGPGGTVSPGGIFFFLLFAGLPWAAGLVVRLRVERVRELSDVNAALQEESRVAVAEERARIARELHDVVSHGIAVTILQARGARRMVGRDDEAARRALDAIERTNRDALADMRRLLALLRTSEDDRRDEPAPGLDRLEQLVDQVRESGVAIDLGVEGEPVPLPPGLDLSAYRIVQEALTNVLKHAGPDARAEVTLRYGPLDLTLDVTNTGTSDATAPTGGHGLVGVAERVSVAGGRLEAGPTTGGWAVTATLPYLANAAPTDAITVAEPS